MENFSLQYDSSWLLRTRVLIKKVAKISGFSVDIADVSNWVENVL